MKFTELPLSSEVLDGVRKAGFSDCTMVQENVLPVSLSGSDVMVQSKTGSGKTAVFLLTVFEKFIRGGHKGTALVVAPTRELAVQIEEDAKLLSSSLEGYKIGCFYGGVGYQEQENELKEGLNLYVGTPGRLLDFSSSHKIDFRLFDTVVLDEADRMFDMGFYPDIQRMFSMMRSPKERQTLILSATLSTKVRNLAWQYMNSPKEIEVQPEEITVKNITQELFHVTKDDKFALLLSILHKINPASCLIFTNMKDRAVEVAERLVMNGYKAEYLMGDMPQSKRLKTIERMKEGKLPILVATDVAARGLQIDDLELVVNYDIPEDFENYVHRIGRTARAGKSGKAITLACEEYIYGLEAIEEYIQMKIPVLWADEVGLESVEDKSAGYRFRRKRGENSSVKARPRSYKEKDGPKKKSSPIKKKKAHKSEEPVSKKDSERYEKLSSMSLEERMAYYRNQYSGDAPEKAKADLKQNARSAAKNPAKTGAKPAPRPEAKKPSGGNAPVAEKKPAAPEVREGFLSKLKKLFKRR